MEESVEVLSEEELTEEMESGNSGILQHENEGETQMDEVANLLQKILVELKIMNKKLDAIKGEGEDSSISNVIDRLYEIQGEGIYDSLSDVCDKIDEVIDNM